ncbi:hypothetical protein [Clostridium algidicarnis]|uniref:hypothetical protein n=1 Tax=Clostridium algidicarnis TaxID=37659 RepID=UPI001C0BDBCE|nr:hypothetical protein [Clostridium algidicarnis]MBU3228914.1 hypothetical protein [Clostridium algidicarnis]MBU3252458.1 hypothetical protein [Clostridium algidicarnis]
MININDIIKFSDYKDIHLLRNDCFVYKAEGKTLNLKGINVERYIYPIFYKMFQPNFVYCLFNNINDNCKNEKERLKIYQEDFLNVLLKLYKYGIIEVLPKVNLLEEDEIITNSFKSLNVKDTIINDIVKCKNVTIISFLNLKEIEPLVDELRKIPFNRIKLINFHPDIVEVKKERLFDSDDENYNVIYEKHSNILNIKKSLLGSDFLITVHSAKNVKINTFVNKCIIELEIPWLNCLINDISIEIGPLVVYKKTSCYDCYQYINKDYGDDNVTMSLKTYKNYRRANLYIAFGYILDETLKFLCYKDIEHTPITVDSIIRIQGLDLNYSIKHILKIANCKTCGQSRMQRK